jgi:epsilon-lactone hydrolase
MQRSTTDRTSTGYAAVHPLDPEDAAITAAMRAMVRSAEGARPGIEARAQFDALMESVLPRDDVTFEADTGRLKAAAQALDAVGAFLAERRKR